MKKNFLLLFMCLLSVHLLFAQDMITISGQVTDAASGQPLIGAGVAVVGTTSGTQTDVNGNFTISAPADGTLTVDYLGYERQQIPINGQTTINVQLATSAQQLEQVVVVGYGTQRKRDVTGSIVSLREEEFEDKPVQNPLNAIQGKASGVVVTNSGVPGAAPAIRVRGVGSINGVAPLYVVDGIFTDNIDFVNPNDIASMEILKDASSLAMFGVQGANGVIIITTKRAQEGQTTVNVNSYAGFQKVTNKIDLANAAQFKMLYNEQLANLGEAPFDFSGYTADTDWQDEIFRTAFINNNSVSIRSGTARNQASFSMNYYNQEGVLKYDSYKRYTAHLRDEFTVNKNLKIGGDISLFRWDRNPASASITNALWASPVFSPFNEAGEYNASPPFQRTEVGNPVATTEINKGNTISNGYRFVGSVFAEVSFLKNFTWRPTLYADLGFNNERGYTPAYVVGDRAQYNDITGVRQSKATYTTGQMDQLLTYAKVFGKHDVTALVGYTSRYKGDDNVGGSRQGITIPIPDNPQFWYLGIGTPVTNERNSGGGSEETFISLLSRVNYSYDGKYLLNLSFRRDGTSKFGPNKRWGNFPSVGAGWVMSEESFLRDQEIVDFLKLKGSWGRMGNQSIGNYLFYPALNTGVTAVFGENVYPAAVPEYIANPDVHWEVIEGADAGIELVTLDNRLNLEANYYNRKSRDLLVRLPVPGAVGAALAIDNAGTILNTGFELSVTYNDEVGSDFGYSISANATTIHNEVLSLGNDIGYDIVSGPARTAVGHPIGAFYGYVQEGIFQTADEVAQSPQAGMAQPGDIRFKDVNDDGLFDDKDRTFIGSPTPDFNYGASVNLTYRNFALGIDVQGVAGNYIYNDRATATFGILNYPANRVNRWTGPGTSNVEPTLDNTRSNNFLTSTYFLEKGDYFRIRNLSLAYNLRGDILERVHVKGARIYINAQNIATFTKATGYSPEVGGSPISFGIDNGTYPVPATFTGGINLDF